MSLHMVGRRTSEVGVVESGAANWASDVRLQASDAENVGRGVVKSGVGSRVSGAVNLASDVGRQTSDANKQRPALPAQEAWV
jgi:hypothetical protein